jgi:ketosteroid isomerase-like protein
MTDQDNTVIDIMTTPTQQTRIQVLDVLDQFARLFGKKDIEGVLSLVALDIIAYRAQGDEYIRDREEFRKWVSRLFSGSDLISLEFHNPDLHAEGTIAWLTADYQLSRTFGGTGWSASGLMAAVLRGTGHNWVLTMMHFSLPAADPLA